MTSANAKYTEGIGRRKTAVARVRITPASKNSIKINEKSLEDYFKLKELQKSSTDPLKKEEVTEKFDVSVKVNGGGTTAQAEAIRLGLSRALVATNPTLRKTMKAEGFLKRDPRKVERKKFGLLKARRSPQWSKR